MNAEILAVGTELLMGHTVNTNATYISSRLAEAGINIYYHSVVGDNPERLKNILNEGLERSDIVILTGGLGPTQDDLTKETVAAAFGKKLVMHEESLKSIEEYFKSINRVMVDSNKKQAMLPEGCIVLHNYNGTAPGCIIEKDGKAAVMLPGPPSEMKPMFDNFIMNYLQEKTEQKLTSKYLRVFGVGESLVEQKLIDLIDKQTNPTIATYAKEGEVTVRVTARTKNIEDGEILLKPLVEEIYSRLGDAVYDEDNNDLNFITGKLLMEKNITFALAESCTGGLIASKLTEVDGISSVFNRGFVSYSNQAKMENLGVKGQTLESFGAVSKETAAEMAEGVRKVSGTEVGLSITGIAGPGGGSELKPVGLVFVGISTPKGTETHELRLWGGRNGIRYRAAINALNILRLYAKYR